jgi:hypothetical protein
MLHGGAINYSQRQAPYALLSPLLTLLSWASTPWIASTLYAGHGKCADTIQPPDLSLKHYSACNDTLYADVFGQTAARHFYTDLQTQQYAIFDNMR